jgi:hypothetical protein
VPLRSPKTEKISFYSEGRMASCAYGFYEYMLDVDGVMDIRYTLRGVDGKVRSTHNIGTGM